MKRKILFIIVGVVVLGSIVYAYINRDHRDIATATVEYALTSQELASSFQDNEEEAIATYLNAVIEVKGMVTIASGTVIELNSGISTQLQELLSQAQEEKLKGKPQITLRGRCIGYDSLLEEVRLDQAFIIE